jgi:hypothetical protein
MTFNLQFRPAEIPALAQEFEYPGDEAELYKLQERITNRGFLNIEELKIICRWKTTRSQSRVSKNVSADIEALTKVCFSTENERLRIGSLLLLDGIGFPTASVILHFFHPEPYPILDFRALEALGIGKPPVYDFDFWWTYVGATRTIAHDNKVTMRDLDKALWQWSKNKSAKK